MKFFNFGLPANPDDSIYGLYQPVLDCFLAITDNESVAKNLKFLLSPRYSLHVVKLNTAKNYYHNIIDNSVCERWTMVNKGDARLTISLHNLPTIDADQLVEKTSFREWDTDKEKEYIQLCLFFVKFFNQHCPLSTYSELNNGLDMLDIPELDPFTHPNESRKKVFNILYSERDYTVAYNKIMDLVNQSVGFTREFNLHLSKY